MSEETQNVNTAFAPKQVISSAPKDLQAANSRLGISIGGFLKLESLQCYQEAPHQKTLISHVLKEQENLLIQERLTLDLTQAEERIQLAEASYKQARTAQKRAEAARHAAENKALQAIQQAQEAAKLAETAEERAYLAEQAQGAWEEACKKLQQYVKEQREHSEQQEQKLLILAERNQALEDSLSKARTKTIGSGPIDTSPEINWKKMAETQRHSNVNATYLENSSVEDSI